MDPNRDRTLYYLPIGKTTRGVAGGAAVEGFIWLRGLADTAVSVIRIRVRFLFVLYFCFFVFFSWLWMAYVDGITVAGSPRRPLRRAIIISAPCGWDQGTKWHPAWVGSGLGGIRWKVPHHL